MALQRPITQKETIKRLAERSGDLNLTEAKAIWDEVTGFITEQLLNGEAIRIKGIGTLRRKDRPAKEVKLPQSGKTVMSTPKVAFKLKSKTYTE